MHRLVMLALLITTCALPTPSFGQAIQAPFSGTRTWRGAASSVTFRVVPFDERRHTLLRHAEESHVVMKIDGRDYSGSDGYVPRSELASINARLRRQQIVVPRSLFRDLFNPSVEHGGEVKIRGSDRVEFELLGGDGAGAFRARFIVDLRKRQVTRLLYEQPDPTQPKRRVARF